MYGELVMADGEYGGSKGRRWKVDWNRSPQPIQVKLKCLRGIKDKLPGMLRRYIFLIGKQNVFSRAPFARKSFVISCFQLVVTC